MDYVTDETGKDLSPHEIVATIAAQAARIAELEAALDMCRGLAHGIAAATSGTLYHDARAIAQTVDAAMLKKG